jgi:electron transport complex protein RnfB
MPAVTSPAFTFAERLDAVLPQTQCARCGHDGCRPYAEAIAAGTADINRCPPGGETTLLALAALTGRVVKAVDPTLGEQGPLRVARIDEAACIGCTLCSDACPVDAILGAQKRMHTVLASLCSGCERCVAPCPVDCILMFPAGRGWTTDDAAAARVRHNARAARLARNEQVARRTTAPVPRATEDPSARRRGAVAAALARARARRCAPAREP